MDTPEIIADRYRVRAVLGRGSFGITHAAEDLHTHAEVAIKQLDLRHVDDWKAVELFEREARVLRNLDHPQIPNYVDFLPPDPQTHRSYLVQELAPGRSLAARLEAGERFSEIQVRSITEQLLDVLCYLSERFPPVVHRDIKPGNVIVDDAGRCYLVDFGSVRDVVEASRTGGSTVAGTFGYMAPEQLHGEATPTSDLFGLGMTVVHLLTGSSPAELERRRLVVDFRKYVRVSESLAGFIDRLIAPVPDDRFAGPRPALDELRGVALELPPAPGGLDGQALAATVARREREAKDNARRKQGLARRQAEAFARRTRPRVELVEDTEGFSLTIAPVPIGFRFMLQLPIVAILVVNPGFAIAGDYPFFGPKWPVFADDVVARYLVWIGVLLVCNLAATRIGRKPLQLRVAGDHFVAWARDRGRPLAAGTLEQLAIEFDEPGELGHVSATLSLGELGHTFARLSIRDRDALERAKQLLAARRDQDRSDESRLSR